MPQWICLSATERYEVLSRFFASISVDDETAFENRVTYDTANSYVNHFLRTAELSPTEILGSVKNFFQEWDDLSSVSLCSEILGNVAFLGQNCIFFLLFGFKKIREIGNIVKHSYFDMLKTNY